MSVTATTVRSILHVAGGMYQYPAASGLLLVFLLGIIIVCSYRVLSATVIGSQVIGNSDNI